jgi:hypothetical protein
VLKCKIQIRWPPKVAETCRRFSTYVINSHILHALVGFILVLWPNLRDCHGIWKAFSKLTEYFRIPFTLSPDQDLKLGPSAYKSELIPCWPGYSVVTRRYTNIGLFDTDGSNTLVMYFWMIVAGLLQLMNHVICGTNRTPDILQSGNHKTPYILQGSYHETPDILQGYHHKTSDILQECHHKTPDMLQMFGHKTPGILQGGYHETSAILRSGYHGTSAILRRGYHETPNILQGCYQIASLYFTLVISSKSLPFFPALSTTGRSPAKKNRGIKATYTDECFIEAENKA